MGRPRDDDDTAPGAAEGGEQPASVAPGDTAVRVEGFRVGDDEYIAVSVPLADEAPAQDDHGLTEAELAVVRGVVDGKSNAEIAEARATLPRTIANQLASIFRKLGVGSRAELAALWTRRATGGNGRGG